MHIGPDGRLRAINPEAGFFGVAPGTSVKTNPNIMAAVDRNTIFTNVAVTPNGEPWWEGKDSTPPDGLIDWRGNPWTSVEGTAAHPNSRFTMAARQCPSISPRWEDPEGVPISAILFGGRRARVAPLVYQSYSWQHGVFVGAGMASETTAAQSGAVGVTRRDPMAMVPFCGYHMADYFAHWLDMGTRIAQPPAIFHVNWFRTDQSGRFLWPGFGDNIRVLKWILERVRGQGKAVETPIGLIPAPDALDLDGLKLPAGAADELLRIDVDAWAAEHTEQGLFFDRLAPRLPVQIQQEHTMLRRRLSCVSASVNAAEPPHDAP
jgi:phosphoenolpyruvate carboxykinase (GTP)